MVSVFRHSICNSPPDNRVTDTKPQITRGTHRMSREEGLKGMEAGKFKLEPLIMDLGDSLGAHFLQLSLSIHGVHHTVLLRFEVNNNTRSLNAISRFRT